ncbi:sigma-70 family RNA polymerase sigma factor [Pelotomaculum isophthalicicum JI]|uniref:Sigma-70 family RNA polymerase sigma factor n=1 Tax=Pelotomaculum isophthalicicum JI TaxID=947010 RepID=A0A9X4H5V2_9FIRM|nr:sigma-70 family RNA polymerase sigma factor [Pelotomaculum isophthalicicum]MDF9407949.1 sigma-70 family RNA polymerase sigma factor [Pelotomaculum isophthalicicum JI]
MKVVMSERDLIRASQAGDSEAFSELTSQYLSYAFRIAFTVLQSQSDAEDLVQESFLVCFRRLAGFRMESSFKTWLTRIVMNLCYDYLRRKRREGAVLDKMADWDTAVTEDWTDKSDRSLELRDALRLLSDAHKTVLVMYYEMDLDIKTVAKILGIPVGTVKSRLANARAMLKEVLERG